MVFSPPEKEAERKWIMVTRGKELPLTSLSTDGPIQIRTAGQNSRETSMESRTRHFLAAKKISKVGSSMGKKDEILGRLFETWHFALLGTGTGQVGFVWINQGAGYARSQAA